MTFPPPLRSIAMLILLLVSCVVGCGSESPAGIVGKVVFQDKPVMEGAIRFTPTDGTEGPGAGARIIEGNYEIANDGRLQEGVYRVSIAATRSTGKKIEREERREGESKMVDQIVQYIPRRYNRRTELRVELSAGENNHDFDLK